jgi:hypothetical protein
MGRDDVSGTSLGQLLLTFMARFFTLEGMVFSGSCKPSDNKPTYLSNNEYYPKKDSPPSNGGGHDDQCDRPESTNADSAFPSGCGW